MILISSVSIGILIKNSYSKRVFVLEKCVEMLNKVSINLNYIGLDTVSILNMLKNDDSIKCLTFTEQCISMMSRGNDFQKSWIKSVNDFNCFLKKEDKEVLISFGSVLGKSDIDGQLKNCNINIQKLSLNLKNAKEQYDKYANLYFRLSILSGILITLIFI